MIYLDYASTTPINEEVLETYTKLLKRYYANADSMHDLGMEVEILQKQSRETIAKMLNVKSEEIIYTSGASEANNLAIKGYALKNKRKGKHIISTRIEHSSTFNALKQLKEEFGFEITLLDTNDKGQVEVEQLIKYLREDTILVSIMGINNETGAIQPINEISEYIHNNSRAVFHMDGVQMIGKYEIDLKLFDMCSFSAHKIFGLKGSGILYKKDKIELLPLISGGQQENGLRGGTSNACANIVLAKTIRLALESIDKHYKYVKLLHDYLYDELNMIEHIKTNSTRDGSPYILNFSCDYISSEIFMNSLNNNGFACSAQSTCSSRTKEPSRVILAMNLGQQRAFNAVRCSISHLVTKEDINSYIATIKEIVYGYKTK